MEREGRRKGQRVGNAAREDVSHQPLWGNPAHKRSEGSMVGRPNGVLTTPERPPAGWSGHIRTQGDTGNWKQAHVTEAVFWLHYLHIAPSRASVWFPK